MWKMWLYRSLIKVHGNNTLTQAEGRAMSARITSQSPQYREVSTEPRRVQQPNKAESGIKSEFGGTNIDLVRREGPLVLKAKKQSKERPPLLRLMLQLSARNGVCLELKE